MSAAMPFLIFKNLKKVFKMLEYTHKSHSLPFVGHKIEF